MESYKKILILFHARGLFMAFAPRNLHCYPSAAAAKLQAALGVLAKWSSTKREAKAQALKVELKPSANAATNQRNTHKYVLHLSFVGPGTSSTTGVIGTSPSPEESIRTIISSQQNKIR